MAAKKTLRQLVEHGTFLARKDHALLAGEELPWPGFAALQRKYGQAEEEFERRAVALAFEKLVRQAAAEASSRLRVAPTEALAKLGPPGSFQQLERFFPWALRHYQGAHAGKAFKLERFQRDFLEEFSRRSKNGRRVYTTGLLAIPKGNGKSPLAAGLSLYALLSDANAPEVYGIAGSKNQAGIARDFAKTWAAEPPLSAWLSAGSTIRCPEHKGSYKMLSSDGRLGQGVNPSAGIVDEWWLFHHQRERETYNAIAKALHKRSGTSWLLAITTAGWDKHSQLGETYEKATAHPKLELRDDGFLRVLRDTKSGFLMHWYGVSDDGDRLDIENPALIRACNPARWVRPADLIAELNRPDCDEYDWRRLHLNQWTAARDAWLPASTWQRLHTDQQIPAGAEVYLGIDIGLRHDSTAVAIAHRLEDGRTLLNVHVWATDPDTAAHTHLERIRLAQIEDHIRELARRYKVREVAYDPHFFQRSAELLEQAGITMVEFLQASGPMADAYQGFYQDALEGRLCHNGDPVLQAHIDATAATRTERGWKIRKLNASERIDATVACVLACARARHHQPRQAPTVYWMEA